MFYHTFHFFVFNFNNNNNNNNNMSNQNGTTIKSSNSTREQNTMNNPNKLVKYMKAPYRGLLRARDSYVSCFTGCAGRSRYGPMMGHPARTISAVPRGFRFHSQSTSGDDDIGDLIRSTSKAITASPASSNGSHAPLQTRSQSFDIGRIDEESEFIDDVLPEKMHPPSRSYANGSNPRKLAFGVA